MNTLETAWLAGLLEGEGYFSFSLRKTTGAKYPCITLSMTDEDVVRKAASVMGTGVTERYPETWKAKGWSKQWRTRAYGEKALEILTQIRPYMGNRRGSVIDDIIGR